MVKKLQDNLMGQMLCVLIQHVKLALIFSIFAVMMLPIWSYKIGEIIFSVIGLIFYAGSMYGLAGAVYERDNKPYTPLSPKPWKGLILPVFLLIVNILIIILYKCSWVFGYDGGTWTSGWGIAGNIFSFGWFSMYQTFLSMSQGNISRVGYAIILGVPEAAAGLGYFLGYKGVDQTKYINNIKYERK